MKIIIYNIGYGTGLRGSMNEYALKSWRYLWAPNDTVLKIGKFLKRQKADVICLLETDIGSVRARFKCQVKRLAKKLMAPFHHSHSKYNPTVWFRRLPFFRHQHDAIISRIKGNIQTHFFKNGMRNLIQEYVVGNISIFVVHLSVLRKVVRHRQLKELAEILKNCPRPHLVCGDFNIFDGLEEIKDFIKETGLKLVQNKPTFPSIKPRTPLDLIFACKRVKVKASGVLKRAMYSDHLPVWAEIEI